MYAAGVLLFELLTGSTPFPDESPLAVAYQHVNDVVPAPSTLVDGIPPSLDALVLTLTQQDPDARPLGGAAALALVEQARRGLLEAPVAAGPPVDQQQTLVVPLPVRSGGPAAGAGGGVPATPVTGVVVAGGPPAKRARRSRGWVALVLVVLVAVAAATAAWWLGSGRYTTVPGVVGVSAKQAESRLAEQGLEWTYGDPAFSEIVPEGQVVSSDPEPGGKVENGGTVTLVLSKGPERYGVPKVTGMTVDEGLRRSSPSGR